MVTRLQFSLSSALRSGKYVLHKDGASGDRMVCVRRNVLPAGRAGGTDNYGAVNRREPLREGCGLRAPLPSPAEQELLGCSNFFRTSVVERDEKLLPLKSGSGGREPLSCFTRYSDEKREAAHHNKRKNEPQSG